MLILCNSHIWKKDKHNVSFGLLDNSLKKLFTKEHSFEKILKQYKAYVTLPLINVYKELVFVFCLVLLQNPEMLVSSINVSSNNS